jgi:hypothetical protein
VKAPALVAVEQPPEAFAPLLAAARARGLRVGWLELAAVEPPAPLAAAAAAGAAKAVAAVAGQTVALKTSRGAPVLRDLLREQFLGCAVVLVRGHAGWPRLALDADGAALALAAERTRRLSVEALIDELVRPRHRSRAA